MSATAALARALAPLPRTAAWGIAGGAALAPGGTAALALAVVGCLALAALVPAAVGRRALAALLVALLVGAGAGTWRLERLAADPLGTALGPVRAARAVLLEAPHGPPGRRSALAELALADGRRGRALLRLPGVAPPRGAIVAIDGALARPRPAGGGFDERAWLARRGVHVALAARAVRRLGRRGGLPGALDRAHAAIRRTVAPHGGDPGALVAGLAAGADEGLSDEASEAMRRAGLAHLLAVSGGNVALVVGLVLVLVWALGGSRRHARLVAIPCVLAFAGIVGSSPSVVRATVAGGLACAAWLSSRPADPWHLMGVGLAALLVASPRALVDPGLQLSFAAVAALLLLAPRLASRLAGFGWFPRRLVPGVAASTACTLATAPISLVHFGAASLVASVPANLAALPLAAAIASLGLIAALLDPVAPSAGAGCAGAARVAARLLLVVARAGARLDAAAVQHAALALGLAAALLAGALLLGAGRRPW